MLDVHVQLCSIESLNLVGTLWPVLICLVYASYHCNQGKLKIIGAVLLMYILMQNRGIQPFLVGQGLLMVAWKEVRINWPIPRLSMKLGNILIIPLIDELKPVKVRRAASILWRYGQSSSDHQEGTKKVRHFWSHIEIKGWGWGFDDVAFVPDPFFY